MPGKEAERLGRQAVERARAIDPENAEIYGELAFMAMFVERDFKSAAQYLEQGLALEPTNLRLISHAALLSLNLGRLADAQVLYEYITAHDPLCAFCFVQLGSVYILEGKLELAERAHETYELLGGVGDGHLTAALTLLLQGRHEASMAAWARSNPGPFRAYGETITLYSMGRNEEFEARFQAYRDQYGADYPTMVARVYAWMGDADAAFEWLGRYHVEQPELGPIIGNFWEFLSVELNSLHDDPRWQEHLARLGIAPKQLAAFEFAVPLPK